MRYVVAVVILVVIAGALAGVKTAQISSLISMGKAMAQAGPPPEVVGTSTATEQEWEGRLASVGSIAPARGVTVSNDAAGVVSAIKFESGAAVKKGQILVELDSSVERAQLASANARRDLAKLSRDRSRQLVERAVASKSQLDSDEASLQSAVADAAALQAQIDRKVVRAPFDGRLGIRQVNIGQYLNSGTPITVLQAIDAVFVDFTLPQQLLGSIAVGAPVKVTADGDPAAKPLEGAVAAVDPTVDSSTRSLKIRATVSNKDETLRPGMFVRVNVTLPDRGKVVAVPATAIVHASYGNSIYVVEDAGEGKKGKVARQQFVKTGESRGDFVAVLDGIKAGQEVVIAGGFKLRNGAGVVVNNQVKLDPQLAPKLENK